MFCGANVEEDIINDVLVAEEPMNRIVADDSDIAIDRIVSDEEFSIREQRYTREQNPPREYRQARERNPIREENYRRPHEGQRTPRPVEPRAEQEDVKKKGLKPLFILVPLLIIALVVAGWAFMGMQSTRAFNDAMEQGNHYLLAMDLEQAEAHFLRAVEIAPREVEPYLLLADVYVLQDEVELAIDILEQGMEAVSEGDREILEDKLEDVIQGVQPEIDAEVEETEEITLEGVWEGTFTSDNGGTVYGLRFIIDADYQVIASYFSDIDNRNLLGYYYGHGSLEGSNVEIVYTDTSNRPYGWSEEGAVFIGAIDGDLLVGHFEIDGERTGEAILTRIEEYGEVEELLNDFYKALIAYHEFLSNPQSMVFRFRDREDMSWDLSWDVDMIRYAELIDFDGDGIPELLIVLPFSDRGDAPYGSPIIIVGYSGQIDTLYQSASWGEGGGWVQHEVAVASSSRNYLIHNVGEGGVGSRNEWTYFSLESGEFVPVLTTRRDITYIRSLEELLAGEEGERIEEFYVNSHSVNDSYFYETPYEYLNITDTYNFVPHWDEESNIHSLLRYIEERLYAVGVDLTASNGSADEANLSDEEARHQRIMSGDFSDIAGTYTNGHGNRITIYPTGRATSEWADEYIVSIRYHYESGVYSLGGAILEGAHQSSLNFNLHDIGTPIHMVGNGHTTSRSFDRIAIVTQPVPTESDIFFRD